MLTSPSYDQNRASSTQKIGGFLQSNLSPFLRFSPPFLPGRFVVIAAALVAIGLAAIAGCLGVGIWLADRSEEAAVRQCEQLLEPHGGGLIVTTKGKYELQVRSMAFGDKQWQAVAARLPRLRRVSVVDLAGTSVTDSGIVELGVLRKSGYITDVILRSSVSHEGTIKAKAYLPPWVDVRRSRR